MDQPTAEKALERLERLVGEWEVVSTWPDGSIGPAHGTTTFAWHPSGRHLVMTSVVHDLPEAPDSISIIGCDAANGTYTWLYADERNVCRVLEMQIDEHEWRGWREGAPFNQRFSVATGDDGDLMAGSWDIQDGDGYRTDFLIEYRRIA